MSVISYHISHSSIELLPSFVTAQNEVKVLAATVVKGNLIQNVIFLYTWSHAKI